MISQPRKNIKVKRQALTAFLIVAVLVACSATISEAFVVPSSVSAIRRRTCSTCAPSNVAAPSTKLAAIDLITAASNSIGDANVGTDGVFDTMMSSLMLSASDVPEVGGISYSRASYYTVLGLYVMSFPGLWSQIKRSTSAKIKRKTFVSNGENYVPTAVATPAVVSDSDSAVPTNGAGLSLRQQAGEIMAYMKSNNYEVVEAGETITFRGVVQRSVSQAFFLTFCTALGLLSLALVLQIQFNDLEVMGITPNWFLLSLFSPYAGIYYWRSGDRIDDCMVKLSTNDAETSNEITVEGSDEEIERMWRTLGWQEKGMVKIDGIL